MYCRIPAAGAKANDIIQYPEPINPLDHTMSSSQSSFRRGKLGSASSSRTRTTTNTTTTKRTGSSGPYDPNFQQRLTDGGVYHYGYRYPDGHVPPKSDNWE